MSQIEELHRALCAAQKEVDVIRANLEEARSRGRSGAIEGIREAMAQWGITLQDLGCARPRKPNRPKAETAEQAEVQGPSASEEVAE